MFKQLFTVWKNCRYLNIKIKILLLQWQFEHLLCHRNKRFKPPTTTIYHILFKFASKNTDSFLFHFTNKVVKWHVILWHLRCILITKHRSEHLNVRLRVLTSRLQLEAGNVWINNQYITAFEYITRRLMYSG